MEVRIAKFGIFSAFLTLNAFLLGLYLDKEEKVLYLRLFFVYFRWDKVWQWQDEYDMEDIKQLTFQIDEQGRVVEKQYGQEFRWLTVLILFNSLRITREARYKRDTRRVKQQP